MKKIIVIIILLIIISLFFIFSPKKDNDLRKIKIAEVAHSIFYAPQYVAHSLGYFEEQGLDVEILLVPGADKVAAAVLSGDVEIGFCGSEATIYIYNQGQDDYLVNFANLTKRDGSFIVSREKIDNFTLEDLKGKTIIGGRMGNLIISYNKKLFFKELCLVLDSFKYSSGFLIFNLIVISLFLLIIILSIILANKNLLGFSILKYSSTMFL